MKKQCLMILLDPRGPFFNPVAYMDPYTSIQIRRESIYLDKYYIYI